MQRPAAGIVGIERDRHGCVRRHEDRIAHGSRERYPVDGGDLEMMTVQVHRMRHHRCVSHRDLDPLAFPDPEIVRALDMLLILHADHEQNCSTSTVRLVGSSQANLFTSISGGINALWGPLHGGANQSVLEMLERIRAEGGDVKEFVRKVKNREDGVKLMGFGHRVYKNFDPRSRILKTAVDGVLAQQERTDPLLDIAKRLEEVALSDDYFIERKLYPNVDFYTGLIYRAMGFPPRMFTVLFAMGRLPGWIAHWREMHEDPATKIGRPRQIYTGYTERDYRDITSR